MSEETTYESIIYPSENDNPFYTSYKAGMSQIDRLFRTLRMKESMLIGGGGTLAFNSGTGLLTWTADFMAVVPFYGKKITVNYGPDLLTRQATLADGAILVLELPMILSDNKTMQFQTYNQLPDNIQLWVAGIRIGSKVYFRGLSPVG